MLTEEDGDALRDSRIVDVFVFPVAERLGAEDAEEEDRDRREEDHLEYRVEGDEDGAVCVMERRRSQSEGLQCTWKCMTGRQYKRRSRSANSQSRSPPAMSVHTSTCVQRRRIAEVSVCASRNAEHDRRPQMNARTHHGDTPRDAHDDQPLPQVLLVRQEGPGQSKHEQGRDDPVDDDGEGEVLPELSLAEERDERAGRDAAEDWPHHDNQGDGCTSSSRESVCERAEVRKEVGSERYEMRRVRPRWFEKVGSEEMGRTDGEGDADKLDLFEDDRGAGHECAEDDPECHGEEDPEGEELVEQLESLELQRGCAVSVH